MKSKEGNLIKETLKDRVSIKASKKVEGYQRKISRSTLKEKTLDQRSLLLKSSSKENKDPTQVEEIYKSK